MKFVEVQHPELDRICSMALNKAEYYCIHTMFWKSNSKFCLFIEYVIILFVVALDRLCQMILNT